MRQMCPASVCPYLEAQPANVETLSPDDLVQFFGAADKFRHLALPDNLYLPPQRLQLLDRRVVALYVLSELGLPEVNAAFRIVGILAVGMPVPETSVNEDRRLQFRQHNVRPPWQCAHMKAKPVAHAVKCGADEHFGASILPPYSRHVPAPLLLRQPIHLFLLPCRLLQGAVDYLRDLPRKQGRDCISHLLV